MRYDPNKPESVPPSSLEESIKLRRLLIKDQIMDLLGRGITSLHGIVSRLQNPDDLNLEGVGTIQELYNDAMKEISQRLRDKNLSDYYVNYLNEVEYQKEAIADILSRPALRIQDKLKALDQSNNLSISRIQFLEKLGYRFEPFKEEQISAQTQENLELEADAASADEFEDKLSLCQH